MRVRSRKQVDLNTYELQTLTPVQVRPLIWRYATKTGDLVPYTHVHRLGSESGLGSWLQVALAIIVGMALSPFMLSLPILLALLAG